MAWQLIPTASSLFLCLQIHCCIHLLSIFGFVFLQPAQSKPVVGLPEQIEWPLLLFRDSLNFMQHLPRGICAWRESSITYANRYRANFCRSLSAVHPFILPDLFTSSHRQEEEELPLKTFRTCSYELQIFLKRQIKISPVKKSHTFTTHFHYRYYFQPQTYVNSCAHSLLSPFTVNHYVNRATISALIWPHPNTAPLWRVLRRRKRKGKLSKYRNSWLTKFPSSWSSAALESLCAEHVLDLNLTDEGKHPHNQRELTDWRDNGKKQNSVSAGDILNYPFAFLTGPSGLIETNCTDLTTSLTLD